MDDCFTRQFPGNAIFIPAAPDVHEVGGGGSGASDRSWMMDGVSPSVLLVPASRRLAGSCICPCARCQHMRQMKPRHLNILSAWNGNTSAH